MTFVNGLIQDDQFVKDILILLLSALQSSDFMEVRLLLNDIVPIGVNQKTINQTSRRHRFAKNP